MKAEFNIVVTVDGAALELEAKNRGYSLQRALEATLSECENRLVNALRFQNCVQRVGSNMRLTPTPPAGARVS